MKRIRVISVLIISFLVLFSCQPQNKEPVTKKPVEDDIQTKKIMIEDLDTGKPVEVEVEYVDAGCPAQNHKIGWHTPSGCAYRTLGEEGLLPV